MKLRTLFTLSLLYAVFPLKAQVGDPRNILAYGFNAGMSTSSMQFSPTIRQQTYTGYQCGLTLRYITEKYFWMICGAQLEINYSQRGWRERIDDGSMNEYSRRMEYVEIPFMAHIGFGREFRGFQGFINLGPQIGFYTKESEKYGGASPWNTENRPNHITQQYGKPTEKKFDYGIAGGLGLELLTEMGTIGVEGRYYFGLSDVFNNTKADFFGRSAHSVISLRLHILGLAEGLAKKKRQTLQLPEVL